MEVKLYIIFITLNIINVVIQTIKSIATVKCGKGVAAVVNAVAYGLYTVVTVYMLCELPLVWKAFIVAMCNLIGVYVVKYFEEKSRKERLWKVEATISKEDFTENKELLSAMKVSHNYIDIEKYVILNFYCSTSKQSEIVKKLLSEMNAKYFVSESKIL